MRKAFASCALAITMVMGLGTAAGAQTEGQTPQAESSEDGDSGKLGLLGLTGLIGLAGLARRDRSRDRDQADYRR